MRKNKTFSVMVEIRSGKASLNASYSMLFSVTHRVKCNNAGVCHLLLYGRHLQKCRFQKSTGLIKAIPKNRMIGLLIRVFLRQDQVQQNCHNCGNDHRRLTENNRNALWELAQRRRGLRDTNAQRSRQPYNCSIAGGDGLGRDQLHAGHSDGGKYGDGRSTSTHCGSVVKIAENLGIRPASSKNPPAKAKTTRLTTLFVVTIPTFCE